MKKYIILLGFVLLVGATAMAQWISSPPNLYTLTDRVGIGTNTPENPLYIRSNVAGTVATQEMTLEGVGGASLNFRKARGTYASRTVPLTDDVIGGLFGQIWHGSAWRPAATLRFFVDGPVSTGSTPGRIEFQVQPVGGSTGASLVTRMVIKNDGKVGIGTTNPQSLLSVNGKVSAKEVEVTLSGWSDFVFADDFNLRPLSEVEEFINTNRHLPDVPSEAEVLQNGVNLGEMSSILLQKIEELTLYIIELNKRIAELEGK